MISRFMLQIANSTQSPTYITSLKNPAKSLARSGRCRKQTQKYFDIFFLLHVPYIHRGTVPLIRREIFPHCASRPKLAWFLASLAYSERGKSES